jgi:hypothetical protein
MAAFWHMAGFMESLKELQPHLEASLVLGRGGGSKFIRNAKGAKRFPIKSQAVP